MAKETYGGHLTCLVDVIRCQRMGIKMFRLLKLKSFLIIIFFLVGVSNAVIDPEMKDVDWPDHKRDLTFCFTGEVPDEVKNDTRTAAGKWNDANTGWTLTEVQNCTGDIKIKYDPEVYGARHQWESVNGVITKSTITIGETGPGSMPRMIMHEFGHAMRLGHKPECGKTLEECQSDPDSPCNSENNVMAAHLYFQNPDLSDEDKQEAETSAKAGKGCKKQVKSDPKDGQRDQEKMHKLSGAEGVDLNLPDAEMINVTPFFASHLSIDPYTDWDSLYIYAFFTPLDSAFAHEGFDVSIWYNYRDSVVFWGILWVTDSVLPLGVFPHAIAGHDTTVAEGELVVLDGTASYHDDPDIKLAHYCWHTPSGNTYGAECYATLTPGVNPVVLTVYDEFGQTSLDTLIVTVVAVEEKGEVNKPLLFALAQNYPNPFKSTTSIQYALPSKTNVELIIYNSQGQKVRMLLNREETTGSHSISWDGRDDKGRSLGSGVYFYQLRTSDGIKKIRKMLLLH